MRRSFSTSARICVLVGWWSQGSIACIEGFVLDKERIETVLIFEESDCERKVIFIR